MELQTFVKQRNTIKFFLIQLIAIDFIKDTKFFIVYKRKKKNRVKYIIHVKNEWMKKKKKGKEKKIRSSNLAHTCVHQRCVNEKVYVKVNLVITFSYYELKEDC